MNDTWASGPLNNKYIYIYINNRGTLTVLLVRVLVVEVEIGNDVTQTSKVQDIFIYFLSVNGEKRIRTLQLTNREKYVIWAFPKTEAPG